MQIERLRAIARTSQGPVIHERSKFANIALHMEGSHADFAPHMEGSHADFSLHMEQ